MQGPNHVDSAAGRAPGGFMATAVRYAPMTVPAIVEERLDGEEVTSRVPLGGDDELFVTPERTLVYRAEGLL